MNDQNLNPLELRLATVERLIAGAVEPRKPGRHNNQAKGPWIEELASQALGPGESTGRFLEGVAFGLASALEFLEPSTSPEELIRANPRLKSPKHG